LLESPRFSLLTQVFMEDREKVLSISFFERAKFFRLWNALERESVFFSSPLEKLQAILKDWNFFRKIQLHPEFQFVSMLDKDYPPIFMQLPQPPLGLYVRGNWQIRDFVSVVGSRKPNPYSLRMTRSCVRRWTQAGYSVVSGGAYGIDAEAHRAALDFGAYTIAVLGSGLNELYPQRNLDLFRRLLEGGGALISEYPPHVKAMPYQFPERNRLIAALGQDLFLAQAHEKSGSLSTARAALEMGKNIFVLRPLANDENFMGSQRLIDSGALSLTNPSDLLLEGRGPDI